jgi:hypothetical protein
MRLGTVLRGSSIPASLPLQVWRGCVGMDNALCQKPPLQVLGEIQIPSLDFGWSQNFMNNSGCTEFKTPPFCFVLMMAFDGCGIGVPNFKDSV